MHYITLSVLMSNYNHAHYLPIALDAILSQSYKPMEIIIIDDASTDNSVEILQSYAAKHKILRIIRNEKNLGAVRNASRLLEIATGDYVYFIAADDKILPGFFEKSMRLLSQHSEAALCSTLWRNMDGSGDSIKKRTPRHAIASYRPVYLPPDKCRIIASRIGFWALSQTAILKREVLIESGGFIPELGPYADGFIVQAIVFKYGACFIPEVLTCWRKMETTYSATTLSNPDTHLKYINYAVNLKLTTYRNWFPLSYVVEWEATAMHHISKMSWKIIEQQKRQYINEHTSNVIFNIIFKSALVMQSVFAELYYYIKYRWKYMHKMIYRKLINIYRIKRLSLSK